MDGLQMFTKENLLKPLLSYKMDDLGVPLVQETSIYIPVPSTPLPPTVHLIGSCPRYECSSPPMLLRLLCAGQVAEEMRAVHPGGRWKVCDLRNLMQVADLGWFKMIQSGFSMC